jgi:hypothetical protein
MTQTASNLEGLPSRGGIASTGGNFQVEESDGDA